MQIVWDCRSIADHMGGIAFACAGWLDAFLKLKPKHWTVKVIYCAGCDFDTVSRHVSAIEREQTIPVQAGFIAPRFEQLQLPCLLQRLGTDLYFNPGFTLPAIKTTRFQATVIHDVVFLDHPEWVDPRIGQIFTQATDLAMQCADMIYTVSNFSMDRIDHYRDEREWPSSKNVSLLRPAVAASLQERASSKATIPFPFEKRQPYLLYLGSVEEKKGIDFLLEGFSHFANSSGNESAPTLIIAGGTGGKAFDVRQAVVDNNIQKHVEQLGPVSDEMKVRLMAHAELFLFPSRYEGFGIPPLEAMCLGTPVIAANSSALPEVLGDAANYVSLGDSLELGKAIHDVLRNPTVRSELIKAGNEQVDKFNWQTEAQTLIDSFAALERVS